MTPVDFIQQIGRLVPMGKERRMDLEAKSDKWWHEEIVKKDESELSGWKKFLKKHCDNWMVGYAIAAAFVFVVPYVTELLHPEKDDDDDYED